MLTLFTLTMYILDIFSCKCIEAFLFYFFKLLHNIARVDVTVDLNTSPFALALIRDPVTPSSREHGSKGFGDK